MADATPERWRPIEGYEDLYEVSDLGRVRRAATGRIHRTELNRRRLRVQLCRANRPRWSYVHHLVLEAFIGPRPDGHECNHKDGDPLNNRAVNLEWVTPEANMEHARKMGLLLHPVYGEENSATKLTAQHIAEIKALRGQFSQEKIAALYGISQTHVSRILRGEGWRRGRR